MSGRGKGVNGRDAPITSGPPSKKSKRDSTIEWQTGQAAVLVSYITPGDMSCANRFQPLEELHPHVKAAVLGSRDPVPEFEWNLDEEDTLETLFEHLPSEEDDEEEDEEIDHDEIAEDVEEWAKGLYRYPPPDVPVQVRARVCIFRSV